MKTLENATWKLNRAVARFNDLVEREGKQDAQLLEMIYQMIDDVNRQAERLKSAARIAPEQVDADTSFVAKLEDSVKTWNQELEMIQKELIDQAIIDGKQGEKSSRYVTLEKREVYLKKTIMEAEQKLGKVTERMMSPAFGNMVNQIVDNAKP